MRRSTTPTKRRGGGDLAKRRGRRKRRPPTLFNGGEGMEKEHVSKWCLMMARSSYSPLHMHTQEPEAIRSYHMCIRSCKPPPSFSRVRRHEFVHRLPLFFLCLFCLQPSPPFLLTFRTCQPGAGIRRRGNSSITFPPYIPINACNDTLGDIPYLF